MRVLVTGASGFIGQALVPALLERGHPVRVAARHAPGHRRGWKVQWQPMGDLAQDTDWSAALAGMDAVIHLAGLAHRFPGDADYDPALYDAVNHQATVALVKAIQTQRGIRRFLFVSTLGVHGPTPPLPITPETILDPATPYDRSKVAAEQAIRRVLDPGELRWAIFRPALVYGPGQRGNMARLETLIRQRRPIPLDRPNQRSFLYVGNLVDALLAYLAAPAPPSGRAWPVADLHPVSTELLVRTMARAMGADPRLLRLPPPVLGAATALGDGLCRLGLPCPWNTAVRRKVLGDLYVDIGALRRELGWTPPFTFGEGMVMTYSDSGKVS